MRILAISVGNTSLFAGVLVDGRLVRSCRLTHAQLAQLPRRLGVRADRVALCSVVPALTDDVRALVRRRWRQEAAVLTATAAHGLRIGYRRPAELGADRVAAALGARTLFPGRHVLTIDCGTATTLTALHRDGTLLGGAILPGAALWPDMLASRTAQLPRVAILRRPRRALGRSPDEGIASGIYFGHLGAMRENATRVGAEAFGRARRVVIGTGGNAAPYAREGIFDVLVPELVLAGLVAFAETMG